MQPKQRARLQALLLDLLRLSSPSPTVPTMGIILSYSTVICINQRHASSASSCSTMLHHRAVQEAGVCYSLNGRSKPNGLGMGIAFVLFSDCVTVLWSDVVAVQCYRRGTQSPTCSTRRTHERAPCSRAPGAGPAVVLPVVVKPLEVHMMNVHPAEPLVLRTAYALAVRHCECTPHTGIRS